MMSANKEKKDEVAFLLKISKITFVNFDEKEEKK